MPPASHRRPSDAPTRARAPSCDRGDFAAGKMLSEGLPERGEITPEDLAQCITDINEKIAKLPEGPQLNPAASDEAVAAVAGKLPPLMDVLLLNHNGYWIGDFMLYTAEQLMGDVGTAIGNNPVRLSCPHPPRGCRLPTSAFAALRPPVGSECRPRVGSRDGGAGQH